MTTQHAQGEATMSNPIVARYQDARGIQHEVLVRKATAGAWQVADVSVRETKLIETLPGDDQGRGEAEAIARDYASQQLEQTPASDRA
jgi:hypothetical protein